MQAMFFIKEWYVLKYHIWIAWQNHGRVITKLDLLRLQECLYKLDPEWMYLHVFVLCVGKYAEAHHW